MMIAVLLCSIQLGALGQLSTEQVYEHIPIFHGDSIVFPITMVNAYPFVSVEVNGIKGKLMFDNGTEAALNLNDNLVNLKTKKKGKGNFGSGQSFDENISDTIAELKFTNGLTYRNLLNIKSAKLDFLQRSITPDLMGFIGYNFFKGYILKLDYLRRKITLYKNTEQRSSSKDFLNGERVIAIINFELRSRPNIPLVHVKIGDTDVLGAFDTGQFGIIQFEENVEKELKAKGLLVSGGIDGYGEELFNVNDVVIDGTFKTNVIGTPPMSRKGTDVFRKALQVEEPSFMCFGYRFLDQYKTVWDYAEKKIYILEK
ncbi:hypothetical protein C7475_1011353 [Chitinophaga sp. S165]|nr:hypothetical protein C7475_1011353 [Chitinophaga sp. S165]